MGKSTNKKTLTTVKSKTTVRLRRDWTKEQHLFLLRKVNLERKWLEIHKLSTWEVEGIFDGQKNYKFDIWDCADVKDGYVSQIPSDCLEEVFSGDSSLIDEDTQLDLLVQNIYGPFSW